MVSIVANLILLALVPVTTAQDTCLMSLRTQHSKKLPQEQVVDSISLALQSSERLGHVLLLAAKHESVSNETTSLLRSFRPCSTCKQHARYGESNDGGYVMCNDDMQLGQLSAAYSYGISGYDGWGNAVSEKYQIPVFEYDCTNPKHPEKCATCDLRFNFECINGNSAPAKANFGTLSQHFQRNGHSTAGQSSMLLKIDVEGAEWPFFAEEPAENLKKFREIVVEFHDLDKVAQHPTFLKAVNNILGAGFVVEHIHGNNNGGQASLGDQMIPKVLEVTYLQRPVNSASECQNYQVLLPEDAKNNVEMADLPPLTLPKL